jgi:hypothetical protein
VAATYPDIVRLARADRPLLGRAVRHCVVYADNRSLARPAAPPDYIEADLLERQGVDLSDPRSAGDRRPGPARLDGGAADRGRVRRQRSQNLIRTARDALDRSVAVEPPHDTTEVYGVAVTSGFGVSVIGAASFAGLCSRRRERGV